MANGKMDILVRMENGKCMSEKHSNNGTPTTVVKLTIA
jgi:hypothetical protein